MTRRSGWAVPLAMVLICALGFLAGGMSDPGYWLGAVAGIIGAALLFAATGPAAPPMGLRELLLLWAAADQKRLRAAREMLALLRRVQASGRAPAEEVAAAIRAAEEAGL